VYDAGTTACDAAYLGRGCWRPFETEWKKNGTVLAAQAQQRGGRLQEPQWRSGQAAPVSFQAFAQTDAAQAKARGCSRSLGAHSAARSCPLRRGTLLMQET